MFTSIKSVDYNSPTYIALKHDFDAIRGLGSSDQLLILNYFLLIQQNYSFPFQPSSTFSKENFMVEFEQELVNYDLLFQEMWLHYKPFIESLSADKILQIMLFITSVQQQDFVPCFDYVIQLIFSKGLSFDFEKMTNQFIALFIPDQDQSIFQPYSNSSGLAIELTKQKQVNYIAHNIHVLNWLIGTYRIIAHRGLAYKTSYIYHQDPSNVLINEQIHSDVIVINIYETAMYAAMNLVQEAEIIHSLTKLAMPCLTNKGKCLVVVPDHFLYHTQCQSLMDVYWYSNDYLEAVISMPNFTHQSNSKGYSVLVFSKQKVKWKLVKLLHARTSFQFEENQSFDQYLKHVLNMYQSETSTDTRYISWADYEQNQYSLLLNRYFIKEFPTITEGYYEPLSDFVSVNFNKDRIIQNVHGRILYDHYLSSHSISYQLKAEDVMLQQYDFHAYELNQSALLVTLSGKEVKFAYFHYEQESLYIPLHLNIQALIINESKILPAYLAYQLSSSVFQEQYQQFTYGTSHKIALNDFLNLKIIQIPLAQQAIKVEAHQRDYVLHNPVEKELKQTILDIKEKVRDDLSIKKHNISQFVNNVSATMESLMFYMKQQNSGVTLADFINSKFNITVEKHLELGIKSCTELKKLVENITNDEGFSEATLVRVDEVLMQCVRSYQSHSLFDCLFEYNEYSFYNSEDKGGQGSFVKPLIKISKLDFEEVFNNILENAIQHGFIDASKRYLFVVELQAHLANQELCLTFKNNGIPFSEEFNLKRYALKGEKAGEKANSGIGGYRVVSIIEHFGGSIKLEQNDPLFPVQFKITFPLQCS